MSISRRSLQPHAKPTKRVSNFERKQLAALKGAARAARRQTVRILNPLPGGVTRLSLEAAVKHVGRGAEFVKTAGGEICLEFKGHQREAAERTQREIHSTIAREEQMQELPMLNTREMLAPSPRRYFGSIHSVNPRFSVAAVNKPYVPKKSET